VVSNIEHKFAYYVDAALCFIFLALPLLQFDVPPLVDYPNHLARVHILANYASDPFLQQTYRLILEPFPNLAMDLSAAPLVRLFGTFTASKMFLAGILFAYCCGCHLLGAAGLGRPNWIAVPCFFTFYSSGFLWGFVNYVAGVAVFLIAFSWWLWSLEQPGGVLPFAPSIQRGRWVITAALALLSYLCHLTAYGFLCVAAGVVVLLRLRRGALDWKRGFTALAPLAPPAFVYEYLNLMGHHNDTLYFGWSSPLKKLPALLNLVRTYDTTFDAAVLVLLALTALAAVWWLRPVRIDPELGAVGAAFLALFLIAPRELFARSASGVDVRFVVPAALLLLLGLRFEGGGRAKPLLLAALVVVLAARLGFIWRSWEQFQWELNALGDVTRQLPRQSSACAVHPVRAGIDESKHDMTLAHFYCLAVISRGAVVPMLFTDPGAQPIEFRVPPPNAARKGYSVDANALQDPALWDYCDSFVTYRETAAVTGVLQERAEMKLEAWPYRLWRKPHAPNAGTRP
jgi:hypothetical protein